MWSRSWSRVTDEGHLSRVRGDEDRTPATAGDAGAGVGLCAAGFHGEAVLAIESAEVGNLLDLKHD